MPLQWKLRVFISGPPGKSQESFFFFFFPQESFLNHNGKEKINLKKREKESFKIDTMPTDLASKESEGVRRQAGEGAGPAGEPV